MSDSGQTNQTVMRMFIVVSVFILLFGGAAIYAAYQTKQLKTELQETKDALEACEGKTTE